MQLMENLFDRDSDTDEIAREGRLLPILQSDLLGIKLSFVDLNSNN